MSQIKNMLIIAAILFVIALTGNAQTSQKMSKDETAVRALVQKCIEGWNKGSGEAFAAQFAEDSDFIGGFGGYTKGRRQNASSHQQIFDTFFKGIRLWVQIKSVRFLKPDVALIHTVGKHLKPGESDASPEPEFRQTWTVSKHGKEWLIDAFQNTPIQRQSGQASKPSSAAKLTAGTLPVSGGGLYYEVQGEGQPIILLHAGGMDSKMWDAQFNYLSQQFRVVRYDQRGFGRSSKPEQSFYPVDDLYQLMQHLGIKRASLVGLSMGAGVALDFALEYPEMVEKLVLVSMSGPPRNLPPQAQIAMTKGKPIFENGKPIFERLKNVSTPTLLLVGEKDSSSVEMAENVVKLIPTARRIVFASVSHFLNSEQPESLNREFVTFLKGK